MNRGQVYASRKDFVENGIGQIMAAKRDFDSIKYARSAVTDREYIRVSDIFGKAVTIEVTGDDLESILHDMCKVMLMGDNKNKPPHCVTDNETLRRISPLFKTA